MDILKHIPFGAAFVLMISLAMSACGLQDGDHLQARVDRALDDVDRDRNAVRTELAELRTDIDARMLQLENEIDQEELQEDHRRDKQQQLLDLEESRDRVQQALAEIDTADDSAWLDVRARSKNLTRSVDNWFERQAEKEDLRG